MKLCFRCKVEKGKDQFWGGCAYCIDCDKVYRKEWREKYREQYAARRTVLRLEREGRHCPNCGQKFLGKGRRGDASFCSTKCKILKNVRKKKNGCWEWKGGRNEFGYGQTTCHETGKREACHRISYRLFRGEIPAGLYVCHACDNPRCCNPDHLWVGTAKQNMQDAKQKNRIVRAVGSETSSAKLTEQDIPEIFSLHEQGVKRKEIAKKYKVHYITICNILQKKAWKHVKIEGV